MMPDARCDAAGVAVGDHKGLAAVAGSRMAFTEEVPHEQRVDLAPERRPEQPQGAWHRHP
jgi:hypothetical protein